MPISGRIHSIESFGSLDGPGIRYVLFLQGCPLQCLYCHNVDTWSYEGGTVKTADEVVMDILRYRSFIATGGVTLSGGEPLLQHEFAKEIMRKCHEHSIHTAIDTSGAVPLRICKEAIDEADLVMLDIKALSPELCKKITGQDNKNALEILRYREETGKAVWIRHVIVPGLTLDTELLEELAEFLSQFKCIKKVELLPFHKMGEYKWEEMGKEYSLKATDEPTYTEVENTRKIFSERGFTI